MRKGRSITLITNFLLQFGVACGSFREYSSSGTYRHLPSRPRLSARRPLSPSGFVPGAPLSRILRALFAVVLLTSFSIASDLPDAPSSRIVEASASPTVAVPVVVPSVAQPIETKIVDKMFVGLALISTGSTFADSYTTLFARQNWLAGKRNVCNVETESPYLYGRHPTVARAYVIASGKSLGAAAAAYYLRKHHRKLWSLPFVASAALSLQGVTQNMMTCN